MGAHPQTRRRSQVAMQKNTPTVFIEHPEYPDEDQYAYSASIEVPDVDGPAWIEGGSQDSASDALQALLQALVRLDIIDDMKQHHLNIEDPWDWLVQDQENLEDGGQA